MTALTDREGLKPCPRCGNYAFMVGGNEVWCVTDRCLRLPPRQSAKEAIAAWNTRAGDAYREHEARRAGYQAAMTQVREAAPADVVERLLALKRHSPSIYGPLIDQTCALLSQADKLRRCREALEGLYEEATLSLAQLDLLAKVPDQNPFVIDLRAALTAARQALAETA